MSRRGELPGGVASDAVERVLGRQASYDTLSGSEQAVVRAAWDERNAAVITALNMEGRLQRSGLPRAEADPDGKIVKCGGE